MSLLKRMFGRGGEEWEAERRTRVSVLSADDESEAGLRLYKEGLYAEALDAFRRAARTDPSDAGHHFNAGLACDQLGRHKEAIPFFEKAASLDPEFPDAHAYLGVAYGRAGRPVEAVRECLKAVRLGPSAENYNSLALVYFNCGDYQNAAKACDKALAADHSFAPALHTLGLVYLDLKNRARVEEVCRRLREEGEDALADDVFFRLPHMA